MRHTAIRIRTKEGGRRRRRIKKKRNQCILISQTKQASKTDAAIDCSQIVRKPLGFQIGVKRRTSTGIFTMCATSMTFCRTLKCRHMAMRYEYSHPAINECWNMECIHRVCFLLSVYKVWLITHIYLNYLQCFHSKKIIFSS